MRGVSREFCARRKVMVGMVGGLTLLGAILAFAYTTFQNDVYGVPVPSV